MVTIIIIAIVALLVIWFISVQKNLVNTEESCKNAMSQIGVQLNSRWDALTSIAEQIKQYNQHEYDTIKDVIAQRSPISSSSSASEANAQQAAYEAALKSINVVVEKYPDVKASELYKTSMDSINTYENQVRMSRMVYNDSVTKYNRIVRSIPSNIVASMLHFETKDYLVEDKAKSERPSMA